MTDQETEKTIVIPGDALEEEGQLRGGINTYTENGSVYAKVVGVRDVKRQQVRVIPFKGRYVPKENDLVIGSIAKVSGTSWIVELNSPYNGLMTLSESTEEFIDLDEHHLSEFYDVGEVVLVKIKRVTPKKHVQLTMKDNMARKITGGRIIEVSPTKVPRLIGKDGTMVTTVKDYTRCTIIVGQNGRVWIKGTYEDLAERAIRKIEEEAHTDGLTDIMSQWLEQELGTTETIGDD